MQSKYQAAGEAETISRVWLTHMLHLGCCVGQMRVPLSGPQVKMLMTWVPLLACSEVSIPSFVT